MNPYKKSKKTDAQIKKEIGECVDYLKAGHSFFILSACLGYSSETIRNAQQQIADSKKQEEIITENVDESSAINNQFNLDSYIQKASASNDPAFQAHSKMLKECTGQAYEAWDKMIETIEQPKVKEIEVSRYTNLKLRESSPKREVYTGKYQDIIDTAKILGLAGKKATARKHGNNGCWLLVVTQ